MPNTVRAAAEGLPKINRRKALSVTGAGLAAAFAGIAATVHAASAAPVSDAELIRLGKEFDRLYLEWIPLWHEMNRRHELWISTIEKRGLTFAKNSEACWDIEREVGSDVACDTNSEHVDALNDLSNRIRVIRPSTLAGLAVWAKITRFDCLPLKTFEHNEDELDWDKMCLIRFLAEVQRLASEEA